MGETARLEAELAEIEEAWRQAAAGASDPDEDPDDDFAEEPDELDALRGRVSALTWAIDRLPRVERREPLSRIASSAVPGIRREAAHAMYGVALARREADDFAGAEAEYLAVYDTFGEDADAGVRETLATSMLNLGYLRLMLQDRLDEALAVYDDLLARFDSATGPRMRDLLAKAAASRNTCLNRIQERDGSAEYGAYPEYPAAQRDADVAAVERAAELTDAGDAAAAATLLDPVVERLVDQPHPEMRRVAVRALHRRGRALAAAGRPVEALSDLDRAINVYGFDLSTDVELAVSRCLAAKAGVLDGLGRHDDEVLVYRTIVDRWASSTVPELHERAAWASWCRGVTLAEVDPVAGAAAYRETYERFIVDRAAAVRRRAAQAACNLVVLLRKTSAPAEAVAAGEEFAPRLLGDADLEVRRQGRWVQLAVARSLDPARERAAKLDAYRAVLGADGGELSADQRTAAEKEFAELGPGLRDVFRSYRSGLFKRR